MRCSVVSYSLSEDPGTLSQWKENLFHEITSFIEQGSEIILYPELFLMGLSKYFKGPEIECVARFTHDELLPELGQLLKNKNVFLVLGSGPRIHDDQVFNSCPVFYKNNWHFQDKLFLTPWETDFTPGSELQMFNFNGLQLAVTVCFDSEQPDLAVKMKEHGVHIVLVPSATTNENGSNRVNRCSSARAVELGAAVITSPLVGDSTCDLVDHNEGRQGFFLPAQEDVTIKQETFSAYSTKEKVIAHYDLNLEMLKKLKEKNSETKPFHKPFHPNLKLGRPV